MLEVVLQKINNLAVSYDQLVVMASNQHLGESSSNPKGHVSNNSLFEGNRGIHARNFRLDFPKFDGSELILLLYPRRSKAT